MRMDEGGYSLGFPPDSLFRDAVKLHHLANFHQRMVVENIVFNYMRLVPKILDEELDEELDDAKGKLRAVEAEVSFSRCVVGIQRGADG